MSCPTQFLQGLIIDDYDFPTDTYLFQDDNAPVHASRAQALVSKKKMCTIYHILRQGT